MYKYKLTKKLILFDFMYFYLDQLIDINQLWQGERFYS